MTPNDMQFIAKTLRAEERSSEDIEKAVGILNKEMNKYIEARDALLGFIVRVSAGDAKSPEETRLLPEISQMFFTCS